MSYYQRQDNVLPERYLNKLWEKINASPYFTVNNLNRDFVQTRGFSVVFRRDGLSILKQTFPFFTPYVEIALQPDCNAFYLNPLLLQEGSRVDPHVDRSLRSYCKTIEPPFVVSVLYVRVPEQMQGGELILKSAKRQVGKITPRANSVVYFQGDLTHSVNAVKTAGKRLSVVCEQYVLTPDELEEIPQFTIESRAYSPRN
ncbi:MAG: 2OG-Fe(II) oxygenase [Leptolyngbyaceae bacterium]|nr:2OG-Fe(II) oxygenase [Leptolyngbyaceae bacterium]